MNDQALTNRTHKVECVWVIASIVWMLSALTCVRDLTGRLWEGKNGIWVKKTQCIMNNKMWNTMPPLGGNQVNKIKVCLWNTCPRRHQSPESYFLIKVKVKVTRSLTLMSFERASLVEYACRIWNLYYGSKVTAKIKVDNRQTNRQDESNMPPIIWSGA